MHENSIWKAIAVVIALAGEVHQNDVCQIPNKNWSSLTDIGHNLIPGTKAPSWCNRFMTLFKQTSNIILHPVAVFLLGLRKTVWSKQCELDSWRHKHVLLFQPSCAPVFLQASSIPDICLSSTWTTHSPLFPPSPPSPYLSVFCLLLQSHVKACLTYACQKNILQRQDEKRGETGEGGGLPDKGNDDTHKHTPQQIMTPTSSHCMGQSGSLKVSDWSSILSSDGLSAGGRFLWEPANTKIYVIRMLACVCVCGVSPFPISWTLTSGYPWISNQ